VIHLSLHGPSLLQIALACARAATLLRWIPIATALARPWAEALLGRALALSAKEPRAPLPRP
jgi:hypothetical protein